MVSAGPCPAEDVSIPPVPSSARFVGSRRLLACLAVFLLSAASLSGAPEEKRIAIYSVVANYTLPVSEREGQDYVGLLELLEPLGSVSSQVSGARWKLKFNGAESDFTAGKTRARIQGRDLDLPANFLIDNNRGLVPLASLGSVLPQILGGPVTYHDTSRRLYVGSVAVHFTPQITNGNPATLVLNFTSPVNPRIATEPGHVSMRFTREPLVAPSSPTIALENKTIPSVAYQESNGAAEITVNTHAPLFVSFSNDGRTITLSTVAQFKEASPTITAPPTEAVVPSPPPAPLTYFAVVDASHGGDEQGATLSAQLIEKDVTLALAQRLSQQLEAKGLPTLVVRDGDTTLTLDQRAQRVNQARPKIYLSVHASSLGHGARIFTSWLPPGTPENNGAFLDWNSAQAGSLALSRAAAANVSRQLQNARINSRVMEAPVRPLNNVASPAIALELAPPASDISAINSSEYQTQVATEVASALAAMRSRLEAGP